MSDYFKFPSTKHIMLPDDENARRDKVLGSDEIKEFLSNQITIEEKVDGANLGISLTAGEICGHRTVDTGLWSLTKDSGVG